MLSLLLWCVFVAVVLGASKPNILFILSDDQDLHIAGYTDSGLNYMPKLSSKLVQKGAFFPNYLDATPLCGPSRSTILTGRYCHNTYMTENTRMNSSKFHPDQEQTTINTVLQDAGYDTVLLGKYINGYHTHGPTNMHFCTYVPPGWSSWYGFQNLDYFGTRVNENGNTKLYNTSVYQTDLLSDLAVRWLKSEWEQSKPFFMYLAPHAPHKPFTPAPRHAHLFPNATVPRVPSFAEKSDADVATHPSYLGHLKALSTKSINNYDTDFMQRCQMLQAVDEMVEAVFGQLESAGALDNTYAFYMGDNGYKLGHYRSSGKRTIWETDIHVPFAVSGPGVQAGTQVKSLVGNYDLFMTWADIAGVADKHTDRDGLSMLPLLKGGDADWPRKFTLQEGLYGEHTNYSYRGIRWLDGDTDLTYAEYCDGELEYYDLTSDQYQLKNTATDLSNDKLEKLSGMLASVAMCKGDTCPGRSNQPTPTTNTPGQKYACKYPLPPH